MPSERRLRAWLLLLLGLVLAGCYEGDPADFREAVVANRDGVTALSVTGGVPVVEVGASLQLAAMATTASGTRDLSSMVSWHSSDPGVLVVDARGGVTAVANGSAQVRAELAQFSSSVTITASDAVLQSIAITGSTTVDGCASAEYSASGHYDDGTDRDLTGQVEWTVDDATVARMGTLAGERNVLVTRQTGTVGLRAQRGGVLSPLFPVTVADNLDALTVTPATPPQIPRGGSLQFVATGNWGARSEILSRAAQWRIDNDDMAAAAIAGVGNGDVGAGLVSAGAAGGTGKLVATCGGQSDEVAITVVYLSSLAITNPRPVELAPNASLLLVLEGTYSDNATIPLNESAAWSVSSVSGVPVTVSNTAGTRGRVTAGSDEGVSTVTANLDGRSVAVSVSVVR